MPTKRKSSKRLSAKWRQNANKMEKRKKSVNKIETKCRQNGNKEN